MHRLILGASEHPVSGSVVIGRHSQCDLVIDSPKVSRQQARVELDGAHAVLVVLSTAVPMQVNGRHVEGRIALADGDVITMPDGRIVYRCGSPPEPIPEHTFMPAAPPGPASGLPEGTFLAAALPSSPPPASVSRDADPTPAGPARGLPSHPPPPGAKGAKPGDRLAEHVIRDAHVSSCGIRIHRIQERADTALVCLPGSGRWLGDRPWPKRLGIIDAAELAPAQGPFRIRLPAGEPLPVLLQRVGRLALPVGLRASAALLESLAEIQLAAIPDPAIDPALIWAGDDGSLIPLPVLAPAGQPTLSKVQDLLVLLVGGEDRRADFRPVASEMAMWTHRFIQPGAGDFRAGARDLVELATRCGRMQWPPPKRRWWSLGAG